MAKYCIQWRDEIKSGTLCNRCERDRYIQQSDRERERRENERLFKEEYDRKKNY